MSQQLVDKIHAAFEPIRDAVEENDEYSGAILAVTYGKTRNESQIWFEEAGNLCVWRAMSGLDIMDQHHETSLLKPYIEMFSEKEIIAGILLLANANGTAYSREYVGNRLANEWLIEQHKMHVETVVKTTMAMTLNSAMQAQAQAALMAQQLAQGKLIQGPFGKGNGGIRN